jgi:hypothetical protein
MYHLGDAPLSVDEQQVAGARVWRTLTDVDAIPAAVVLDPQILALEAKVGTDYLLAVTADHGMPSAQPGSRHFAPDVVDLLHQKFDPQAKQLVKVYEPENAQMFIDEDRLSQLGLTLGDLAHFLEAQPYVFAVFTQDEVRRAADAARR